MIDGLNYVPLSDIGVERDENQDYQGHDLTRFGLLFVVADGMGGHAGGATASQMAVNEIKRTLRRSDQSTSDRALEQAIRQANYDIWRTSQERFDLRGMGSTVVAMLIDEHVAHIAHVGDSRIYMLRGDTFMQLTKDHTMVQRLVDDGILTEEAARHHPTSHVLSRSLGGTKDVMVESSPYPIRLEPGDLFLMCSDGLTGPLEDYEIGQILRDFEPHEAARILVDEANARGGLDNTTISLIQIESLPVQRARVTYAPPPPPAPREAPPKDPAAGSDPEDSAAEPRSASAAEAPASAPGSIDAPAERAPMGDDPSDDDGDAPNGDAVSSDEPQPLPDGEPASQAEPEPPGGAGDEAPQASSLPEAPGGAIDATAAIDDALSAALDGERRDPDADKIEAPEDPTQSQVIALLADNWDDIAQSLDEGADPEDHQDSPPATGEGGGAPLDDIAEAAASEAPDDPDAQANGASGDPATSGAEGEAAGDDEEGDEANSDPEVEGAGVEKNPGDAQASDDLDDARGDGAPAEDPYPASDEEDFVGVDEFGAISPQLIAYSALSVSSGQPLKLTQAPAKAPEDAAPDQRAAPSSLNPTILMIACVATLALGLLMGFMLGYDRVPTLEEALQSANQRLADDQVAIKDLKSERDQLADDLEARQRNLSDLQSERDVIKEKLDELDGRHKADQELIQTLQQDLEAARNAGEPTPP